LGWIKMPPPLILSMIAKRAAGGTVNRQDGGLTNPLGGTATSMPQSPDFNDPIGQLLQRAESEGISTGFGRTPEDAPVTSYAPKGMYAHRVKAENRGSTIGAATPPAPAFTAEGFQKPTAYPQVKRLPYDDSGVPIVRAAGGAVTKKPRIDRSKSVRWMSELSKDGTVFYRDKSLPRFISNNGKRLDIEQPLLAHEMAEYAQMKRHRSEAPAKDYIEAHKHAGIPAERKWIEDHGFDWNAWEAWCRGQLSRLEKQRGNQPPDPDVVSIPHGRGNLEETLGRADGGKVDGSPNYDTDVAAIGNDYPALKPLLGNLVVQQGQTTGSTDDRQLEFYQPWDSDNPNPGKLTSELFDPVQKMAPSDRRETIAGDLLHHLGTINPSTGVPVDPQWYSMKQELGAARSGFHLKADQDAYARERANPSYQTSAYPDWDQNNRLDAYVRAGVFPKQNREWNEPELGEDRSFIDEPRMQEIYRRMRAYLKGQNRASGGRVMAHYIEANPTEAQKQAGNYRKAHVRVHGLEITIENAKGSKRSGIGKDGKSWSVTLPYNYGYIKGSRGADGDHIDVLLGPHHQSKKVFVVDQGDAETGKFDEHKVGIGWGSMPQFRDAYVNGFSDNKGKDRLKKMTEMDIEQFKQWLRDCDTTKPVSRVA
jgi:hypothetical protein